MNSYEKEKDDFVRNFIEWKDKRIVLYGIGRFTATLISSLSDWNIVGLMDKNPNKIGDYVYGLPIISREEAESKADVIIVNTSGTYWNMIFQRIRHLKIPIYYRNGEEAKDVDYEEETEYWNASYEQLKKMIDSFDIISIDFFDTLFCRKTYLPSEIWEYVGNCLKNDQQKEVYLQLRKGIYAHIDKKIINIYDIYGKMYCECLDLMPLNMQDIMEKEMELEDKFIEPRYAMLALVKEAIRKGKELYIVSDMYLPMYFFTNILLRYDVRIPKEHVWISCECGETKKSGKLWRNFKNNIIKEKTCLHIGDNEESDISNYILYTSGEPFFVMSPEEIFRKSSIRDCLIYADNSYHSMLLGLCISKLFNNPFSVCDTKGKVKFDNRKDFGYCIFGPVVFTFLFWLKRISMIDAVNQLCFLGRDGYFLKQDFDYLCVCLEDCDRKNTAYLETSRQILMCASIENANDFEEYMQMPYVGKIDEFFEDRLQIKLTDKEQERNIDNIIMPGDYELIKNIICEHEDEIREYIKCTKDGYKKYLNSFKLKKGDAVVDLGFYGTTQHYLSKLLAENLIGYYIVANCCDNNRLGELHILKSCTVISSDKSNVNSYIHNLGLFIESFLTSPHGMIRTIDRNGQFICSSDTGNQYFFEDKVEINEGIKLFIKDMVYFHSNNLIREKQIYIDDFIDNWYGLLLKNSVFSEEVKRSFYSDNAFIHRRQECIFNE